jgi:hypothetical protein
MNSTETYSRKALDRTRRGTCPCCLKDHNCLKHGPLTRHGWQEHGRKRGSYGQGFQWGECWGTSMRPLEETDRDGLVVLARLEEAIADTEAKLAYHVDTGAGSYPWAHRIHLRRLSHGRESDTAHLMTPREEVLLDFLLRNGFSTERGEERGTYTLARFYDLSRGVEVGDMSFDVTSRTDWRTNIPTVSIVTDGSERGLTGASSSTIDSIGFHVPSYETQRRKKIERLRARLLETRETRDKIAAAIAHHKESPSWGTAHGKKKCVHLACSKEMKYRQLDGRYLTDRREYIKCSFMKRPCEVQYTTTNVVDVTCSRCLKSMK